MSQRAAIARALATDPQILLLDEPFGALDALTKIEMQKEIIKLRRENRSTMLIVTHDIEEAVYLADRVIVMTSRPGKIKDIVKIELSDARNRGSADFAWYKQRILVHFFNEDEESRPEFSI
jgi:ABC-type nitrate/sulfonate/bicarbonate transport system ATPase subunit